MRYFEKKLIADRYDQYRPRVHGSVVQQLLQSVPINKRFECVADIACGTGHSTEPLIECADRVHGTDISEAMLNVARERVPAASFYLSPAEKLPFGDNSLDAIFVCMALHWFDQEEFLSEAARTLKKGGILFVYNMWFPGKMTSKPEYTHWHAKEYWVKFPNPIRHRASLKELLVGGSSFRFAENQFMDIPVILRPLELRNYLMTQSNIDLAIDQGHQHENIERWIDEGISSFFDAEQEEFIYSCAASYAVRI